MTDSPNDFVSVVYANYWRRKQLLSGPIPAFPVRRWWPNADGRSEIEQLYQAIIQRGRSVLDVGAGDLRVMRQCQQQGYTGEYHTQDVGHEYAYTYRSLDEVRRSYDTVLCFDVIEHLPLADGLRLVQQMASLLNPGGSLLLQTPNARCIRAPLAWDMSHLHCYTAKDLWAYLSALDLETTGYRVLFQRGPKLTWSQAAGLWLQKVVVTQILGCDYTDNIALIGTRKGPVAS